VSAQGIGYAAAVALAAVFAIAAVAKLRDLDATARDFEGLGLPRAVFFSRMVPLAELSIVALLLIVPAAGAIAALFALAFFTTVLIGRLRAGVHAPCACFGASRPRPISRRDIVRNFGMMMLAAASLAADRPAHITLGDALVVLAAVVLFGGALRLTDNLQRT
jgi:uncharacterized membrane protein YphA (DoxX/SURF4 family)